MIDKVNIFYYVIELNTPIKTISELSRVQADVGVVLVRKNFPGDKIQDDITEIVVFNPRHNDLVDYEKRKNETYVVKHKNIKDTLDHLKSKDIPRDKKIMVITDGWCSMDKVVEKSIIDYENELVELGDIERDFADDFVFTPEEEDILTRIRSHPFISDNIKSESWKNKTYYD